MLVRPRVHFVGFLLVMGLVIVGCQPVQPLQVTPASSVGEVDVESKPVTNSVIDIVTRTASVTETVTLTESAPVHSNASNPSESPAVADAALMAAGLSVYRAQYCGVCHTLEAAETRGTFGPTHNGLGALADERIQDVNYHGTATNAVDYIYESIVDPQAYIVPGYAATSHRMPVYAHLDSASLNALVAFLAAQ